MKFHLLDVHLDIVFIIHVHVVYSLCVSLLVGVFLSEDFEPTDEEFPPPLLVFVGVVFGVV